MKRALVIALVLPSLLLGLLATAYLKAGKFQRQVTETWRKEAATYPAEVARARQAGIPLSVAELKVPLPPADENAAPLYAKMLDLTTPGDDEKILDDYIGLTSPTPEQIKRARQALARCADLVRLVHQAAARPKCVFKRDWDLPNPADITIPEIAAIRHAVRILTAESLLLAQGGKGTDAVRDQALGFAIARHAASDVLLIGYLVGQAVDGITLSGMRKILYTSNGDAAVARAVQEVIERGWRPRSLVPAMKSEAAFQQSCAAMLRRDGFFVGLSKLGASANGLPEPDTKHLAGEWRAMAASEKALTDANTAYLLRQMQKVIAAVDLPYPQAIAAITPVERDIEGAKTASPDQKTIRLLAAVVMPIYSNGIKTKASGGVSGEVVRVGAAVLVYRAAHNGDVPETLDAVISPVPTDPFDGKPLRYRREDGAAGAGFVVYSAGPDGTFDGGKPDVKMTGKNSALLFRFPAAKP